MMLDRQNEIYGYYLLKAAAALMKKICVTAKERIKD